MPSANHSAAPSRRRSTAIILVLVSIPALYYAFDRNSVPPPPVAAAVQGSGNQLADLEHTAGKQPTSANRINLSQALIANAQYGRAADVLQKVIAENPRNVTAWNNLCVAHTLQQDLGHAIEDCRQGLRVDSSFQLLQNNLKWAEAETAKVRSTLAEQEKTAPAQRTAAFYLDEGMNFLHLGAYDQAIVAWRRSASLAPKSALAYNDIGTAQMLQHRYPEAEASFHQAAALDPANQLVRNNLAWSENVLRSSH